MASASHRATHGKAARERLLEAAVRAFADKGYRRATVAEICRTAGTNVAAVNYYFRTKETLYAEAWRTAFQRSIAAHPPNGGVPPDAPAEQRLRGHIVSLMSRISDPETHEFAIMHKELANPTGLLEEVVESSVEPIVNDMKAIVRELLGQRATEQEVLLCQMSIRAQCFDVIMQPRMGKIHSANRSQTGPMPMMLSTDVLVEHVFRFSLAGIREIRTRTEAEAHSRTEATREA